MNRITNLVSFRDNGKILPFGASWLDSPELTWTEYWDYWGEELYKRWTFNDQQFEFDFKSQGFEVVNLLSDETGFLVFPDVHRSREANIFNGDITLRCILKPVFNVRDLSESELNEVSKAKVKHYGHWNAAPHFKQQSRNDSKRNDGVLEVEGHDGITDCMYFFDVQTGSLVGAKPFAWID